MAAFEWEISPCKMIGPFHFGEPRINILTPEMNKSYILLKKKVKSSMDQYRDFHCHYTESDHLRAIEIFGDIRVTMGGVTIFPGNIETLSTYVPDLQRVSSSYISKSKSLGFFVPDEDGVIESVLVADEYYYDFVK